MIRFVSRLAIPALLAVLVSGCGVVPTETETSSGQTLQGRVHGGQQPVAGAHVYLFAANTAGYGSASISLLDPASHAADSLGAYTTTDASGSFTLSGYTCVPGQQVYLLAEGGNPGLAPGTNNPALALMTVLGTCPNGQTNFDSAVPFVFVNEVTTVASVYSLAGFMSDATHVSASNSQAALKGLANAFLAFGNLADVGTGNSRSESSGENGGNGDVPQSKINTLADLLAPCINSTGLGSGCSTLLTNAKDSSGSTPADTVTALLNIAHNPVANVAALYGLVTATAPYQPTLTVAPNDWTLAITFYAPNMVGPYFPAIDSAGDLWVPGYASNSLTEFSPTGALLSGQNGFAGGGLNLPYSVAIDSSDNAWIVNFGPLGSSSVSKFGNDGTAVTGSPYACAAACFFGAFDAAQNLWVSGTSAAIVLSSAGSLVSRLPTTAYDSGIAIDSGGHGWTICQGGNLDQLILLSTVTPHTETVTAASGNELTPVAIDGAGNVWYVSNKNNAIGESDKSGSQISPAGGYTGGGLNGAAGVAIDGSGRVWVANRDGNSLSGFTSAGAAITPATGYRADGISGPRGIAIDGSGNVWLTNFTYNSVTEFLGLATPTATPISPANHGQRP